MVEVELGTNWFGGLPAWFWRCSGAVEGARSLALLFRRRAVELKGRFRTEARVPKVHGEEVVVHSMRWASRGAVILMGFNGPSLIMGWDAI